MELYIPPVRHNKNLITGKFLKGNTPHNKGRKWNEYLGVDKQLKALDNLLLGHLYNSIGHHKKSVIAIKNNKIKGVFDSATAAEAKTGIKATEIGKVCRKDENRKTAGGFQWFFENSKEWIKLIR